MTKLQASLQYLVFCLSLSRLQVFLNTYGIQTQTPQQVEPIQIWPQKELVKVTQLSITCARWLEGCSRSPMPPGQSRGCTGGKSSRRAHASLAPDVLNVLTCMNNRHTEALFSTRCWDLFKPFESSWCAVQ